MSEIAPVLLIFFNRPTLLQPVFEQIRAAKPRKLYLAQDGPRPGVAEDAEKIQACRRIVEHIDWECEVHQRYAKTNAGCGQGPYQAIDWAFQSEDSLIVLEDDCIASSSFFPFCSEMLERYRDDDRIFLITGCNLELQTTDQQASYFFGLSGTNWGWASWRRNWGKMDFSCSWVKNRETQRKLFEKLKTTSKRLAKREMAWFYETNRLVESGQTVDYWDVQWQAVRYLQHQLSIIPSKNLITNIGLGDDSTHARGIAQPKQEYNKIGRVHFCFNHCYELEFPLQHPTSFLQNFAYDKKIANSLYPGLWDNIAKKIIRFFRVIAHE